MCVCVCVCVVDRQTEREKEREREGGQTDRQRCVIDNNVIVRFSV